MGTSTTSGSKHDTSQASSMIPIANRRAIRGGVQEYSSVSNGEFYDDEVGDEDDDVEGDGIYAEGPIANNNNDRKVTRIVNKDDDNRNLSRRSRGSSQESKLMTYVITALLVAISVTFLCFLVVHRNSKLSNKMEGADSVDRTICSTDKKTKADAYEARTIHYDSSKLAGLPWNPYDLDIEHDNHNILILPSIPSNIYNFDEDKTTNDNVHDSIMSNAEFEEMSGFGYVRCPDIVNGSVVFVSEGDLFWAQLPSNFNSNSVVPAMKLATTIGNVLYPKINPVYPYLIAFRATYDGRSDVYLVDIRPSTVNGKKKQRAVQRLTYEESEDGISKVVGWHPSGQSLLYSTISTVVGLRDERIYEISLLQKQGDNIFHVLEIRPVPLSQSVEGLWTVTELRRNMRILSDIVDSSALNKDNRTAAVSTKSSTSPTTSVDIPGISDVEKSKKGTMPIISPSDELPVQSDQFNNSSNECFYFVRFRQYSHTVRYVGGTAESLWAYCLDETVAVHITHDYNGTSTHPQLLSINNKQYLFFMSDRMLNEDNVWIASTMNLWSIPLPNRDTLYGNRSRTTSTSILASIDPSQYVQLTHISCQFNGRSLQEYSVDSITGAAALRVGADLYYMSSKQVQSLLSNPTKAVRSSNQHLQIIPFNVFSDFREQQERFVKVDTNTHVSAGDLFKTSYGSLSMLVTVRGQVWVTPVVENYQNYEDNPYEGSGQNMPERRYRVVPGAMTGGSIRVLKSLIVPLLTSSASRDELFDFDSNETLSNQNKRNITGTATPKDDGRRLALILATDPHSPTAELGFYLLEIQADSINSFTNLDRLPKPFVGGTVSGGSTRDGGLGSILPESLVVSPCGRRFAWADTDNRICVMTMPIYVDSNYMNKTRNDRYHYDSDSNIINIASDDYKFVYHCLPETNENNEPMAGTMADMKWSPGGRYLAVSHTARNQFNVITIVDCGTPAATVSTTDDESLSSTGQQAIMDVQIGRAVQVTPSRFNSYEMYWGISSFDLFLQDALDLDDVAASTLYYLSDRDIVSDVLNPWGTRQPSPHFPRLDGHVYALPFTAKRVVLNKSSNSTDSTSSNDTNDDEEILALLGRFGGGAAMEVFADEILTYKETILASESSTSSSNDTTRRRRLKKLVTSLSNANKKRRLTRHDTNLISRYLQLTTTNSGESTDSPFPSDIDIDFGNVGVMSLSNQAYRLSHIPKAKYLSILTQATDDGSLVLVTQKQSQATMLKDVMLYSLEPFPSDAVDETKMTDIVKHGLSTDRKYFYLTSEMGKIRVTRTLSSSINSLFGDEDWVNNRANIEGMTLSLWPALEYEQMYNDAWRMHRDYFYDVNMHGVDWISIHSRYKSLVPRCSKREELDDVLAQMIAEVSALHSFVYGGEKSSPKQYMEPAFLGVGVKRVPEWKGYMITEIPETDPDFNLIDGNAIYSPCSDQTLRLTGQKGLQVGDVIVAINGESVLQGSHLNMHLRGLASRSVRLDVLRLASGTMNKVVLDNVTEAIPEAVIVVPIDAVAVSDLRYAAWEWKTRQKAKELATIAGFSVGYIHMQAMDRNGEDAFARGFFPDYDKDALILDVRHNQGGNIDSWVISVLQRKAWSYWSGRGVQQRDGDIDWNEQFAFLGKIVVLVDEFTASNGEGVARGIQDLGLGVIMGMRTWGGGIWGSSANHLVDGGIAAAPQWGVFSDKWGWGGGIEMTGLTPDIVVDNDPHMSYNGIDTQLERAISELQIMIKKEPTPGFKPPKTYPDMSLKTESC